MLVMWGGLCEEEVEFEFKLEFIKLQFKLKGSSSRPDCHFPPNGLSAVASAWCPGRGWLHVALVCCGNADKPCDQQ